jgi:hypothetical protein
MSYLNRLEVNQEAISGPRELTGTEIELVGAAGFTEGAASAGLGLALGGAKFGTGFGVVSVGLAFAAAPLTIVAMAGLFLYAGYSMGSAAFNP